MAPERVIHIVDDDDGVREALTMIVESAGHRVRSHATAEALLKALPEHVAGCVVTDVRMPGMSGMDLLKTLHSQSADLPVVVITGHGDVAMAVQALKAGAIDFIEKPFDANALLDSLDEALQRGAKAASRREALEDARGRIARLTEREREVMRLVVDGMSNAAVAGRLGISVRTVENHRARVMEKMEVRNLSDLVRLQLLADGGDWGSSGPPPRGA